jgi:CRISPR/Cas system-associated endonuclease Cas1
MNIIKNTRNRVGDDPLNDCLIIYITNNIYLFFYTENAKIIQSFHNMKNHRGLLLLLQISIYETENQRLLVMDKNYFETTERDLKLSRRETTDRSEASIPYSSILLNMLLSPSSLRNLKMRSHNSFGKYEHVAAAAALLFGTLNLDDDAAAAIVKESVMEIRYSL